MARFVRNIRMALAAFMVVGATLVLAGPALAAGGNSPTVQTANLAYGSSDQKASFSDSQVAASDGTTSGKEQVRYTLPNGLPKAEKQLAVQQSTALHPRCLVASFITRAPRKGEVCGRIAIGTPIINSGILRSTGRFGKFHDVVHQGDSFYLVDGQWKKGKCGNDVWFHISFAKPTHQPAGPVLPMSKVTVVQNFSWTATVMVHATVNSSVSALAECYVNGVLGARATATGSGSAYGDASASATAATKQDAIVTARNAAQKTYYQNVHGGVQTSARASASTDLSAHAAVWCNQNVNTTTTTTTTTCQTVGATNIGGPLPCMFPPVKPPTPQNVKITFQGINDIPVYTVDGVLVGGCVEEHVYIDTTVAGLISISPKKGSIGTASCEPTAPQVPSVPESVKVGHNEFVVFVWAPAEADKPSTDTLNTNPVFGGLTDAQQQTLNATSFETYGLTYQSSNRPQ